MKKLTKIWGVGLTLVLVASMLLMAVPASASELAWGSETLPGTSGNVRLPNSDISDMAVSSDGQTIWAVVALAAGSGNGTYKSTDGGVTFSSVTNHANIGTASGVQKVAIAPDDTDIVAIAADENEVYVTTNGGTTWGSLGNPMEGSAANCTNIYDIDISQGDAGTHYVGVAGIEAGPLGNVWYFNVGSAAPAWTETNDKVGWADVGTDISRAVAFSPNFASDKVMTTVTANLTGNVWFEIYSMSSTAWNETGASFASYPVSLVVAATTVDTIVNLDAADISLAPDYLGSDDSMRIAFVGLTVEGTGTKDGIYRLIDTSKKEMKIGIDVNSVAYDGTNLVAGENGSNITYYCSDPLATSPSVSTTSSLKRPGGDTNVIVLWAGMDVVAGTTGTSSSFNVSRDNGKSYNGLSLVDDGTFDVTDVAISADGSVFYVATDDGTNLSVWRSASGVRERVLAVDSIADAIIRIAPEDSDSIYVADPGTAVMYYSSEGGDTKWFLRSSRYTIGDLAVESADVCYVSVSGSSDAISTSTNSGFTWATSKDGKLYSGYNSSLKSLGEDLLLNTSTTGYVSYSTDGNDSWTQITKQVNSSSTPAHATASGLAAGDFIYAASQVAAQNVRRWEIGTSTSWSDIISGTLTAGYLCYGIEFMMVGDNDVVYILGSDGTDSAIFRTLDGSGATDASVWSNKTSTDADNEGLITGFTATSGSAKLWAIETGDEQLFSFTDTAAEVGPTLLGPATGTEVIVNPVSGGTFSVSLSWERLSKATSYDVEVSLDDTFKEDVVNDTVASTASIAADVVAGSNFNPNTTYYWRVRLDSAGPLYSPYSETRTFTIGDIEAPEPVVIQAPAPAAPAPIIKPEVIVPTPTINLPAPIVNIPAPQQVVIPPAPAPAPAVPTVAIYAIIIIGAFLVIALIVLIMRTRRPI